MPQLLEEMTLTDFRQMPDSTVAVPIGSLAHQIYALEQNGSHKHLMDLIATLRLERNRKALRSGNGIEELFNIVDKLYKDLHETDSDCIRTLAKAKQNNCEH